MATVVRVPFLSTAFSYKEEHGVHVGTFDGVEDVYARPSNGGDKDVTILYTKVPEVQGKKGVNMAIDYEHVPSKVFPGELWLPYLYNTRDLEAGTFLRLEKPKKPTEERDRSRSRNAKRDPQSKVNKK